MLSRECIKRKYRDGMRDRELAPASHFARAWMVRFLQAANRNDATFEICAAL